MMRFEPSANDLPRARLVTIGRWPFTIVDIVCATSPVYEMQFLNISVDQKGRTDTWVSEGNLAIKSVENEWKHAK